MIERYTDPVAYRRRVEPLLMRDEARYNLELAVLARVATGAGYGGGNPLLLTVGDEGAAMQTPPYGVLVSPVPFEAAADVADYLAAEAVEFTSLLGDPATVSVLADRYAAVTGRGYRVSREQGVYRLRELVPPRPAPGEARLATEDDWDLFVAWWKAFEVEVHLPPHDPERARDRIRDGLTWLWVDGGEPVSMAGCGGFTPNGARVGPVYTPPALRGRGYAGAVTAAASESLLARGLSYCFLYTDLANPTSNGIYKAIGYEHVADAVEVTFQ